MNVHELDLLVGSLITVQPTANNEQYQKEHAIVAAMQSQLHNARITCDLLSAPGSIFWRGKIVNLGQVYQLARLAVRLEQEVTLAPVLKDGAVLSDEIDPFIGKVWKHPQSKDGPATAFPQIVYLQGIYSYYLPVDFAQPVWLPMKTHQKQLQDVFFGSSVQLLTQTQQLSAMLQKAQVPADTGALQCLEALKQGAEESMAAGHPLIVW